MKAYKFRYNGGSHPGEERTVIGDNQNNMIKGFCLLANEWRQFHTNQCEGLQESSEFAEVTTDVDIVKTETEAALQQRGMSTHQQGDSLFAWQFPRIASVTLGNGVISLSDKNGCDHLFTGHYGGGITHYIDHEEQGVYSAAEFADVLNSLV